MLATTHYDTLKVARDAPLDVIRAAYKALSRIHEDKLETLQVLGTAFKTLSDPEKKLEYDLWIQRQMPRPQGVEKPGKPAVTAASWVSFAAKAEREAQTARDIHAKAIAKAAEAAPSEREKVLREKWAAQTAKDVETAEKKAADAAARMKSLENQTGAVSSAPGNAPLLATHYDTLKVSRDACPEVIRAVYVMLAQKYHPDRNLTDPEAGAIMQTVNVSYRILSHPEKRAVHDAWIRGQETPPEAVLQTKPAAAPTAGAASALAAAMVWAEQAEKEATVAEEKAAKATADAAEKATEKDAAVRKRWAEKLALDAREARKRAERAAEAVKKKS